MTTPRTTMRSAIASGVVVVLSVAAVVATSAVGPTPPPVRTDPTDVAAAHAQLSCPELTSAKGITSDLFAVTPPVGGAGKKPGELAVHVLGGDRAGPSTPLASTDRVGEPIEKALGRDDTPAVTVEASDGLAPATYAAQQTTYSTGKQGGLAVAPCTATADSWWFAGLDTAVGATSRLVLSNPTSAIAVVDLAFYGKAGIVNAPGRTGIPIAPHAQQSLDLARFAPGEEAVTVHVRSTRGRVAAAVDVARVSGVSPAGHEWLAPSQSPAPDLLVDPADPGDGDQRLVLTNVSGREALVDVRVLEEKAPFTPQALSGVRLRPGHTVVKDVSQVTEDAAAFEVTSDQQQAGIVATVVSDTSQGPVDLSTVSSSAALTGPAVVAVFPRTRISLGFSSAQAGGGVVELQGYDDTGSPVGDPERVSVKPGTSTTWNPTNISALSYIVVTRSAGDVHGSVRYQGRTGRASIPIVSSPTTVTRPAVRPGG